MTRKAVFVLGMHRSGTSAIAGATVQWGARAPKTPIPAAPDNPLGFWEPQPLMQFHERMLSRLGLSWDSWESDIDVDLRAMFTEDDRAELRAIVASEFDDAPLMVIKDPRLALFLRVWLEEAPRMNLELCPLIILRSPIEVALSLHKRDHLELDCGILMWLRYNLLAEKLTRHLPRCIFSFDEFMQNSRAARSQLASRFELTWSDSPLDQPSIVDPKLRHHANTDFSRIADDEIRALAAETYDGLMRVHAHGRDADAEIALDKALSALDGLLRRKPALVPQRGTVTKVAIAKHPVGIAHFQLEAPVVGAAANNLLLDIFGWVVADPEFRLQRLEVWRNDAMLATTPANDIREDVAAALPDVAGARRSGFSFLLHVPPDHPYFELKLCACSAEPGEPAQNVTLAEIAGWLPRTAAASAIDLPELANKLKADGDLLAAISALQAALAKRETDDVDECLRISQQLCERGQLNEALGALQPALSRHPKNTKACVARAYLYRSLGQHEAAHQFFLDLLTAHPSWASLRYEAAIDLQVLARHAEAVEQLTLFLQSEPGHVDASARLDQSKAALALASGTRPEAGSEPQ